MNKKLEHAQYLLFLGLTLLFMTNETYNIPTHTMTKRKKKEFYFTLSIRWGDSLTLVYISSFLLYIFWLYIRKYITDSLGLLILPQLQYYFILECTAVVKKTCTHKSWYYVLEISLFLLFLIWLDSPQKMLRMNVFWFIFCSSPKEKWRV